MEIQQWRNSNGETAMELQQWSYSNGLTAMELQQWSYSNGDQRLMVDFRAATLARFDGRFPGRDFSGRMLACHGVNAASFSLYWQDGATISHCRIHMGSVPPHFLSIGSNGGEAASGRDNLNIVKFTWGQCRLIFFPLAAAESKRATDNFPHCLPAFI